MVKSFLQIFKFLTVGIIFNPVAKIPFLYLMGCLNQAAYRLCHLPAEKNKNNDYQRRHKKNQYHGYIFHHISFVNNRLPVQRYQITDIVPLRFPHRISIIFFPYFQQFAVPVIFLKQFFADSRLFLKRLRIFLRQKDIIHIYGAPRISPCAVQASKYYLFVQLHRQNRIRMIRRRHQVPHKVHPVFHAENCHIRIQLWVNLQHLRQHFFLKLSARLIYRIAGASPECGKKLYRRVVRKKQRRI